MKPPRHVVLGPVLACLLCSTTSHATYSIVARDPDTGELGVAVQTHWFNVGALVPWARSGVGAVATQSLVDVSYGPLGLEVMAAGRSAPKALAGLLAADEHPEIRQVAFIDANGNVAAHTGDSCIPEAGHRVGTNFSVQANLMDRDTVPQAMFDAFENSSGPLAERMLAALHAAEAEGGDIRGKQSAAMLVVSGTPSGNDWSDVILRLEVADHPEPLEELERLYRVHLGYEAMNAGDVAIEEGDATAAEAAYARAEEILGDNLEAQFWHAVALANDGRLEDALPIFGRIFAVGENWRRLTPRLVPDFLQVDESQLERILGASR